MMEGITKRIENGTEEIEDRELRDEGQEPDPISSLHPRSSNLHLHSSSILDPRSSIFNSLSSEPASAASSRTVFLCEVLLVLAAGVLSFSQLDCSLQEPEETLYAEIPRQMLAQGQLLVPMRHGQAFYDKPPLFYWLVMGMYRLCGVHDWAARFVSSSAAFFCVLVTYAWGKRTVGPWAAFAGALMLCLSPRWAQLARMVSVNSLLTLWVIAALAAAHLALRRNDKSDSLRRSSRSDFAFSAFLHALCGFLLNLNRRGRGGTQTRLRISNFGFISGFGFRDSNFRWWWLLSALFCGLGILTKGPVALVLVAVPTLLYQWLNRRSARLGWRPWAIYLAVVALIALPWFVILAIRDPSFLYYFVWIHHVRRVLDPIDHPQPFWYYGPVLLLGMMPWSLLSLGFVKRLLGKSEIPNPKSETNSKSGILDPEQIHPKSGTRRLPFYGFRISNSRLVRISDFGDLGFILLAGIWSLLFFSAAACKRPCYILPIMPPLALALGCYVAALWRSKIENRRSKIEDGRYDTSHSKLQSSILSPRPSILLAFILVAAASFLLLLAADHFLLPRYADKYSVRGRILPFVEACSHDTPVMCYPHIWDGVSFYLQRNDVQVYRSTQLQDMMLALEQQPQSLVVIKEDAYLDRFLEALPGSLEFIPCTRQHPVAVGWVRRRLD
jgi:dolichol-phosphate mannosyltransferase